MLISTSHTFLSFLSSIGVIWHTTILERDGGRGIGKHCQVTKIRKAFSLAGDECERQNSVSQDTNRQAPQIQRLLISYNALGELLGDHS